MTRQLNPERPADIPGILDAEWPDSTFVVIPHNGFAVDPPNVDVRERLSSWPVPGLAILGDMWLGDLDACLLEGPESPDAPLCPDAGALTDEFRARRRSPLMQPVGTSCAASAILTGIVLISVQNR